MPSRETGAAMRHLLKEVSYSNRKLARPRNWRGLTPRMFYPVKEGKLGVVVHAWNHNTVPTLRRWRRED